MSTGPREIGTLIAVLLKARNLPNKRHIGKQDPYCVVEFDGRKHNTKVIKRGGQHPEWDEEIRFTLYELDANDTVPDNTGGKAPPPPPKKGKGVPNVQGGTFMKISCYAQDVKEPDFIGDTHVDLTEVLTKGETDEWFTLTNKDRYCGEVYLELTFWSNEPAPVKKAPVKAKAKKQYGGPGTFTAHPDARGSSESLGGSPSRWSPSGVRAMKTGGSSNTWRHSFTDLDVRPEALPPSLRSSSSIAQIGLYRPNYENTGTHNSAHSSHSTQQSASSVSSLTDELGQMNLRRRLSLPQITHTELVRGTASSSSTNWSHPGSVGYSHASYSSHSDDGSAYNYEGSDNQVGAVYPVQHRTGGPSLYQPPYEPVSRAASVYSMHPQPTPSRGPRHSLPSASSGFVPLPTSASSAFPAPTPAPQMHTYQPPPVPATPMAPTYGRGSVAPSNVPQTGVTTTYAPPSGPPPNGPSFRPPTTAPGSASYPPALSHTPAPPSPFSALSQQLTGSTNPLSQAASYQSITQSQSSYSYHSYPTSSSISSVQYPQPSTPPSAASTGSSAPYHSGFQQGQPTQFQQQHSAPPPAPPTSGPPPPVVGNSQPQTHPHALPQVPPPPPLGQMQVYGRSAPPDRTPSQMSTAPSQISINIPPPPPLNPSPSQSHMSRPLPEVPQNGPSPVKRSGTMSMALSHAVSGGTLQPSVTYPSYSQIPPPPPLTNTSSVSAVNHGPHNGVPPPPPLPENRQLAQPPIPQSQPPPQAVPAPPSHHQPPKRTQSAQALYQNAIARQQAALGANPLPPPPPPIAARQQQPPQPQQSAYHVLQQRAASQNFPAPPINNQSGGGTAFPGPPRAPSVYPGALGALPMPPALPSSQSVHQQYNAVNANGWQ